MVTDTGKLAGVCDCHMHIYDPRFPHPSVKGAPPDDLELFRLLEAWAPKESTRRRILVTNPARLYGFAEG